MSMNVKQKICVVVASVMTFSLLLLPVLPLAQTVDPVEPDPLEEYDVQGYDEEGNAVLTNDDYEAYMAKMFAERAEKIAEGKDPDADEEPVKKN